MAQRINIYYAGTDPDDYSFAKQLADRVRGFARPMGVDLDLLESGVQRKPSFLRRVFTRRVFAFPSTSVWILSKVLFSRSRRAETVLRWSPERNLPRSRVFLICRGIDSAWIQKEQPELVPLMDDVMVADESAVADMVAELREYRPQAAPFHSWSISVGCWDQ
jgi:hypothetical protein